MKNIFLLILVNYVSLSCCLFDPFSIGVAIGLGALGYNYKTIKDNTYCQYVECCNADNIKADIDGLERELKNNLFGQHIVIQQLIPALRAHLSPHIRAKKPLVISFHGTPGTGKNYVADFLAKTLYKKGLDSRFVHKFLGRSDFPIEANSQHYQAIVNQKVRDGIWDCPNSLFIFDEVDKMPQGVFESLTSLLDHHHNLDGVDYSKAIFIFLSNTAGVELAERLATFMKMGAWREDTQLHDFERTLEVGAYNLDGGLKRAGIIESHLIDHFIPFLPLEKTHVEQCLKAEYKRWDVTPTDESIQNIITNFITFDRATGLFSTSGCKTLEKKVAVDVKIKYSRQ